jgi:hypothetical protein
MKRIKTFFFKSSSECGIEPNIGDNSDKHLWHSKIYMLNRNSNSKNFIDERGHSVFSTIAHNNAFRLFYIRIQCNNCKKQHSSIEATTISEKMKNTTKNVFA